MSSSTKPWDLNAVLGHTHGEIILSAADITLRPIFTEDYLYSDDEIRLERESLLRIGMTARLVVEKIGDEYILIGPLLPYIALSGDEGTAFPCIVRRDDLPQIQQVLSARLNSEYSRLSPLVYSRLITRLSRLFPIMKSLTGSNLGIKREWIAGILGLSSSAVLRFSYISKVPEALQLRCRHKDFPYLCYKECQDFSTEQYRLLLEELIHYELRSRYLQISAADLSAMISRIASSDNANISHNVDDCAAEAANTMSRPASIPVEERSSGSGPLRAYSSHNALMPALYEPHTEQYYNNLLDSYEDRFETESSGATTSELMRIAHKDGYMIPDETLKDISYQLYCLTRVKLTSGQRLLDYACLRSISDSLRQLYDALA